MPAPPAPEHSRPYRSCLAGPNLAASSRAGPFPAASGVVGLGECFGECFGDGGEFVPMAEFFGEAFHRGDESDAAVLDDPVHRDRFVDGDVAVGRVRHLDESVDFDRAAADVANDLELT